MEIVLNEAGIPRENSVAIGDSPNDLDMIRYAALGIAVGNARDELKAEADVVVAAACGEGAVAEAFCRFVL
jgi:hydroxymethylpyrimidine pyrophosphatase-like HAD family hydrolase